MNIFIYLLIFLSAYLLLVTLWGKGSTSGRNTALRIPVLHLENAIAEMVSTLGWKQRTNNGVEGWKKLGATN